MSTSTEPEPLLILRSHHLILCWNYPLTPLTTASHSCDDRLQNTIAEKTLSGPVATPETQAQGLSLSIEALEHEKSLLQQSAMTRARASTDESTAALSTMEMKRNLRRLNAGRGPFDTKPVKNGRGKPFATTKLDAAAKAGSSELECIVPEGCVSGMLVVIGEDLDDEEERHIAGIGSIVVDHPLSHTHPVGTPLTIYDLQGEYQ